MWSSLLISADKYRTSSFGLRRVFGSSGREKLLVYSVTSFTRVLQFHGHPNLIRASTFPLLLPCLMSVFCVRGSLIRFMKAMVKEHVKEHVETYEGEDAFRGKGQLAAILMPVSRQPLFLSSWEVHAPFVQTVFAECLATFFGHNFEGGPKLWNPSSQIRKSSWEGRRTYEGLDEVCTTLDSRPYSFRYCDMIAKAIFQSIDNVPAYVLQNGLVN